MMNKYVAMMEFMYRADLISESFLRTTADICLYEAKANIEKEVGFPVSIDKVRDNVIEAMHHWVNES